jgi:hypothetical protein
MTVRIPAQVFRTLAPIRAIDCISLVIVSYYVSMVCIDRSRKARGVCDCSLYLTPKQEYSVKVTAWLSCDSPSFRGAPVAVAHAAATPFLYNRFGGYSHFLSDENANSV